MEGNKSVGVGIICYSACLMALWIPAFIFGGRWGQDAIEQQLYSFSVLNQIGRDWSRPPYSDIVVVDQWKCPDDFSEAVFSRPWYGVDIGCDCLGISEYSTAYNLEGNGDRVRQGGVCTRNQTLAGCR